MTQYYEEEKLMKNRVKKWGKLVGTIFTSLFVFLGFSSFAHAQIQTVDPDSRLFDGTLDLILSKDVQSKIYRIETTVDQGRLQTYNKPAGTPALKGYPKNKYLHPDFSNYFAVNRDQQNMKNSSWANNAFDSVGFEIQNYESGDSITVYYSNVGTFKDQPINARIKYSNFKYEYAPASIKDFPQNPAENGIPKNSVFLDVSANMFNGVFFGNARQLDADVTFLDKSGKEIDLSGANAFITTGSLNTHEYSIFRNYSLTGSDKNYLRKDTNVALIGKTANGVGPAFVGQNNNFSDNYLANDFSKNSVSYTPTGTTQHLTMGIESGVPRMIFTYSTVSLGTEPPKMEKKVQDLVTKKMTNSVKVSPTQTLTFDLTQKVDRIGETRTGKYNRFEVIDKMPKELEFVKGVVLNEKGQEMSGMGDWSVTPANDGTGRNFVKFTANKRFLESEMKYEGETYTFRINAKVKKDVAGEVTFINEAERIINKDSITVPDPPTIITYKPNKITKKVRHIGTKVQEDEVTLAEGEKQVAFDYSMDTTDNPLTSFIQFKDKLEPPFTFKDIQFFKDGAEVTADFVRNDTLKENDIEYNVKPEKVQSLLNSHITAIMTVQVKDDYSLKAYLDAKIPNQAKINTDFSKKDSNVVKVKPMTIQPRIEKHFVNQHGEDTDELIMETPDETINMRGQFTVENKPEKDYVVHSVVIKEPLDKALHFRNKENDVVIIDDQGQEVTSHFTISTENNGQTVVLTAKGDYVSKMVGRTYKIARFIVHYDVDTDLSKYEDGKIPNNWQLTVNETTVPSNTPTVEPAPNVKKVVKSILNKKGEKVQTYVMTDRNEEITYTLEAGVPNNVTLKNIQFIDELSPLYDFEQFTLYKDDSKQEIIFDSKRDAQLTTNGTFSIENNILNYRMKQDGLQAYANQNLYAEVKVRVKADADLTILKDNQIPNQLEFVVNNGKTPSNIVNVIPPVTNLDVLKKWEVDNRFIDHFDTAKQGEAIPTYLRVTMPNNQVLRKLVIQDPLQKGLMTTRDELNKAVITKDGKDVTDQFVIEYDKKTNVVYFTLSDKYLSDYQGTQVFEIHFPVFLEPTVDVSKDMNIPNIAKVYINDDRDGVPSNQVTVDTEKEINDKIEKWYVNRDNNNGLENSLQIRDTEAIYPFLLKGSVKTKFKKEVVITDTLPNELMYAGNAQAYILDNKNNKTNITERGRFDIHGQVITFTLTRAEYTALDNPIIYVAFDTKVSQAGKENDRYSVKNVAEMRLDDKEVPPAEVPVNRNTDTTQNYVEKYYINRNNNNEWMKQLHIKDTAGIYPFVVKGTVQTPVTDSVVVGDTLPEGLNYAGNARAYILDQYNAKTDITRLGTMDVNGQNINFTLNARKFEQIANHVIYLTFDTKVSESGKAGIEHQENIGRLAVDGNQVPEDKVIVDYITGKNKIEKFFVNTFNNNALEKQVVARSKDGNYRFLLKATVEGAVGDKVVLKDELPAELKYVGSPQAYWLDDDNNKSDITDLGTITSEGQNLTFMMKAKDFNKLNTNIIYLTFDTKLSETGLKKDNFDVTNVGKLTVDGKEVPQSEVPFNYRNPKNRIEKFYLNKANHDALEDKLVIMDESATYPFMLKATVQTPVAQNIVVADTLPNELMYTGNAQAYVLDENHTKTDITNRGHFDINGQNVVFTLKAVDYQDLHLSEETSVIYITFDTQISDEGLSQNNFNVENTAVLTVDGKNAPEVKLPVSYINLKNKIEKWYVNRENDDALEEKVTVENIDKEVPFLVKATINSPVKSKVTISDTLPEGLSFKGQPEIYYLDRRGNKQIITDDLDGTIKGQKFSFSMNVSEFKKLNTKELYLSYETQVNEKGEKGFSDKNVTTLTVDDKSPEKDDVPVVVTPHLQNMIEKFAVNLANQNGLSEDLTIVDDKATYPFILRATVQTQVEQDIVISDTLPSGLAFTNKPSAYVLDADNNKRDITKQGTFTVEGQNLTFTIPADKYKEKVKSRVIYVTYDTVVTDAGKEGIHAENVSTLTVDGNQVPEDKVTVNYQPIPGNKIEKFYLNESKGNALEDHLTVKDATKVYPFILKSTINSEVGTQLVVTDSLPEGLRFVGNPKAYVSDENNNQTDITEQGTFTVEGQNLTFTMPAERYQAIHNNVIYIKIDTKLSKDGEKGMVSERNIAQLTVDDKKTPQAEVPIDYDADEANMIEKFYLDEDKDDSLETKLSIEDATKVYPFILKSTIHTDVSKEIVITDKLPEGLVIKGKPTAYVQDENNDQTDITKKGTFTVKGKQITFRLSAKRYSELKHKDIYIRVDTKVSKDGQKGIKDQQNIAELTVDGKEVPDAEVPIEYQAGKANKIEKFYLDDDNSLEKKLSIKDATKVYPFILKSTIYTDVAKQVVITDELPEGLVLEGNPTAYVQVDNGNKTDITEQGTFAVEGKRITFTLDADTYAELQNRVIFIRVNTKLSEAGQKGIKDQKNIATLLVDDEEAKKAEVPVEYEAGQANKIEKFYLDEDNNNALETKLSIKDATKVYPFILKATIYTDVTKSVTINDKLPEGLTLEGKPTAYVLAENGDKTDITEQGTYGTDGQVIGFRFTADKYSELKNREIYIRVNTKLSEAGQKGIKDQKNIATLLVDKREPMKAEVPVEYQAEQANKIEKFYLDEDNKNALETKLSIKAATKVYPFILKSTIYTDVADKVTISDKLPDGLTLEGKPSAYVLAENGDKTDITGQGTFAVEGQNITFTLSSDKYAKLKNREIYIRVNTKLSEAGQKGIKDQKNIATLVVDDKEPLQAEVPIEYQAGQANKIEKFYLDEDNKNALETKLSIKDATKVYPFILKSTIYTDVVKQVVITDELPEGLTLEGKPNAYVLAENGDKTDITEQGTFKVEGQTITFTISSDKYAELKNREIYIRVNTKVSEAGKNGFVDQKNVATLVVDDKEPLQAEVPVEYIIPGTEQQTPQQSGQPPYSKPQIVKTGREESPLKVVGLIVMGVATLAGVSYLVVQRRKNHFKVK